MFSTKPWISRWIFRMEGPGTFVPLFFKIATASATARTKDADSVFPFSMKRIDELVEESERFAVPLAW